MKTPLEMMTEIILATEYAVNLEIIQGRTAMEDLADVELLIRKLRKTHPSSLPENPNQEDMQVD